jgi:signal transduction histidine kinase/CheY-like chemotaxis protein
MEGRANPTEATLSTQETRAEDCLAGGGEMGAMMRRTAWRDTLFGSVASWPQSLRTAISIMLESRFAMVVAWGPEFRFFYNDRYLPVLGTKHPRSLGAPGVAIFPEVWDVVGPEFERVRRGEAFAIDDWLLPLNRSGYLENCWFTVSYSPIRDETGGVGGVLAVVAETTGKVESERRLGTLRELAARAATAATPHEACTTGLAVFEHNQADVPFAATYLLDDARLARLVCSVGLGDREAATMPAIIDLEAQNADDAWPIGRVLRSGGVAVVDDLTARYGPLPGGLDHAEPAHTAILLPLTRPGLAHPYGVLIAGVSPRRALDDRYRGFFELAADHISTAIANALSHEEQRRRAEALAEVDRAKTAFFSNVSHEFRTPLTLMLGPLEDLLAGRLGPVPGEQQSQHAVMHRNALRLLKLVNSLLDFSRIEADRMQASFEPTDLAAVTIELASMFRSAVERAGLELVVDCPPLPAPVHVDRAMWEKIFLNLLSNAFKFTFVGRIAIRLRARDGAVELDVADTGCGIPPGELTSVFTRFHRVQGARSRSHEGTGIGLALAQELTRLHGGAITVTSTLGAGTTFTVSIPTGTAHLPADRIAAQPSSHRTSTRAFVDEADGWVPRDAELAAPAGSPTASARRVLVADDNADLLGYLTRVLGAHWRVEAVADGDAALAAAQREPPDVVVSDVMMPGLDGFALLRALRAGERTRRIPVILLSARAGEEARVDGLDAGADDYLVKPFSALELVARVQSQLARRAAEDDRAAALAREEVARREAALHEQHLHELFMLAPLPICILRGHDLVIELANPACCQVWRKAHADVIKKPLQLALPEVQGHGIVERLHGVLATGEPYIGREVPASRSAGAEELETAFFNFVYSPLRSVRGTVDGVLVIAADVTEQKRAREELSRTLQYSEMFAGMLGHDLRNPLNAIMAAAQLIERRSIAAELAKPVRRILHSGDRMSRMIAQLLDFTRVRVGRGLRLQRTAIDLAELGAHVVDELRTVHDGARIELTASGSARGHWDGDRIAQVMSNLVGNALEHGRGDAPVVVAFDGGDPVAVRVTVENHGAIPAHLLPILFDPFRTTRHKGERSSGLGLGLFISKEIIEAHGGDVVAATDPERGTRFTITLPRGERSPT